MTQQSTNNWPNNQPIIDRTIKTWLPERPNNGLLNYWPYDWEIIDRTISKLLTEQWTRTIARTATTLDLSSSLVNKYFPKAEWMVTLSGRTGGQTDDRTSQGIYLAPHVWHGHSEWPNGWVYIWPPVWHGIEGIDLLESWYMVTLWFVEKPTLQF